jgi:pyruvate,orthophosphate dikinase
MVEENLDDADGFRGFAGKTRSVLPAVEDKPISGVRLGVTYPEITAVQVQAIIETACCCKARDKGASGTHPLVGTKAELQNQREVAVEAAEKVMQKAGVRVKYMVGTMIEIPGAALMADQIDETAKGPAWHGHLGRVFTGWKPVPHGRDDAGKFLPYYLSKKILSAELFQTLDQEGVGQLVDMGIRRGRATRPDLKVGICGEHGGDPKSVEFCHKVNMNYVSCSPYRVPIARLAAAQAAVR